MAELGPMRRSGRKRRVNRKYYTDSCEEPYGLSSGSEKSAKIQKDADPAEEDSNVAKDQENGVPDEYEVDQDEASIGSVDMSRAEEHNVNMADDSDVKEVSPVLVNDGDLDSVSHATLNDKSVRYKPRVMREVKSIPRSKGLIELASKRPSKEDVLKVMAGANPQDWVDFLRSRDRWMPDPTLPTREGSRNGRGGMCHHFSHTEDKRKMEATVGWDWYYDQGGRELFMKRQRTQTLTPDEGLAYVPKPLEQSHKFLMGPYGNQQVFNLHIGHSMCLNDAWSFSHETRPGSTQPEKPREGWMLNLGTSVKCLDWATNQDGAVQYLAAATAQPKAGPSQPLSEVSPAFTPSAPLRSCIQIWKFVAKLAPGHQSLLDSREPPALQLLICTEWGEIKQLKWCQVPRVFRGEDSGDTTPLGLLASVWSDGLVRVLDVHLEKKEGATATTYGKCILHGSAFTYTHNEKQSSMMSRPLKHGPQILHVLALLGFHLVTSRWASPTVSLPYGTSVKQARHKIGQPHPPHSLPLNNRFPPGFTSPCTNPTLSP